MLARTTGSALARNITGKRKTVRAGAIKPNTQMVPERKSGALVKQPKSSSAIMKPMAPLKEATGSAAKPAAKDDYMTIIHSKVLEIEGILKGTLAAEKEEQRQKRKARKDEDKANQEKKLEAKDDKQDKKGIKMPKVPQVGIFGWIKRFVGNVILGIFLSKMVDFAPALGGFIKAADGITTFLADVGIKLVDGLATFVDWGYKAYDATQGFLENFGVGQEQFDQFSGAVSGMIDALIIGSVILAARGEDGLGPGGLDKARRPQGRTPGVTQGRGGQKPPKFTNPFRRSPVTQSGKPGMPGAPVTQGRGGQGTRPRLPGTGPRVTGGTPRGGLKVPRLPRLPFGGLVRQLAGPVINTLLAIWDFSSRKSAGQTDLQAGAGTGGGILGSIAGAAIAATLFPEPTSTAAGLLTLGILGSLGYAIGGAGADKLTGADQVGYNEGGRITKKTKVKRGIKTKKKPKKLYLRKPVKQNLKDLPRSAEGQEPEQQREWWDFLGWAGTGQKQPLGPGGEMLAEKVTNVGNTLGRDDFFGPVLKVTSKIILDQKVDNTDYQNVSRGINLLLNDGIKDGKVDQGAFKYQEGGEVLPIKSAIDAGKWIENTFRSTIRSSGTSFMRSGSSFGSSSSKTRTNESTAGPGTAAGERDSASGEMVPGTQTGSTTSKFGTVEQKKMLDAIAFAEGTTGSYGTLYGGRVIDELAAGNMSIAEVLKMQKSKMYKGESVYGSGYDSNATGRYQFMSYVLEEEIGKQGVDPSELFTNEMQDRLILNRISRMRGVTPELLVAEGMSDKVIDMLAPEFASFPNLIGPDAQGRVGTNTSYYGQGGKTAAEIKKAYGDSTGESSAIEIADTQAQPASVQPSPSTSDLASTSITPVDKASKAVGPAPAPPNAEKEAISGALGDFMKANRSKIGVTGSIHQWLPRHPPKKVRSSYQSYHNINRALDIGGWSPSSPAGGGADEQAPVIAALLEWNKKNGYNPVELIHGSPAYKNVGSYRKYPDVHHHHVHVAYEKGGMTLDGPHLAMLGEKGKEIVIDNDSSVSEVSPMLLAINAAKNKQGVLDAIQNFAPYDERSNKTILVQDDEMPEESGYGGQGMGGVLPLMMRTPDNSFDFLEYQG